MFQLRLGLMARGALALVLGSITGCNGGGGDAFFSPLATTGNNAAATHANLVLKDALGNSLTASSTTPYSPRKTCGACHDVDGITNGYHFQQGRTNADGQVIVRDNYFADGRAFVRSSGMYGKW